MEKNSKTLQQVVKVQAVLCSQGGYRTAVIDENVRPPNAFDRYLKAFALKQLENS